jgi:hypothetical protein
MSMKKLILIFLLVSSPAFADVTVDVTQLPPGCEQFKSCIGWNFLYHYIKITTYPVMVNGNGHPAHVMKTGPMPTTYSVNIWNQKRGNLDWASTLDAAGKIADQRADENGVE